MNTWDATTKTGGHSLIVNKAACTTCHSGVDKLTPIQTEIDGLRKQLGEELVKKKLFKKTTNATTGAISYSAVPSHDFYGTLFPTTQSTTLFATALVAANTINVGPPSSTSSATGIVTYANNVTMAVDTDWANRIGREWEYGELGAASS